MEISKLDEEEFEFSNAKTNHSIIIDSESIDIPLGRCKLYTLGTDNGTSASGITATHNDYYAVINLKSKIIYVF